MLKIALNAGHYLYTAGKRCLKSLDKNETREWTLNDRICDKVEKKLTAYTDYELLRIDDTTGKTDKSVEKRAAQANEFGADIYVSVHHNAGINGGSGGGVMAYTYTKVDDTTRRLQKLLYDKIIAKTRLKGNRVTPLSTANFAECRLTRMPAVLLECGFMDSSVDVPIILSEDFAEKTAEAIVEAIAEFGSLAKVPSPTPPATAPTGDSAEKMYYVQAGAFKVKANAEALAAKLKAAGFNAIIKEN